MPRYNNQNKNTRNNNNTQNQQRNETSNGSNKDPLGFTQCTIIGTLESVPNLEKSNNGLEYTEFVLIVNTYDSVNKQNKIKYVPITAFGKKAVYICNYGNQGQQYTIVGDIMTREYNDAKGNERLAVSLKADNIF